MGISSRTLRNWAQQNDGWVAGNRDEAPVRAIRVGRNWRISTIEFERFVEEVSLRATPGDRCDFCSRSFVPSNKRGPAPRFCSQSCRQRAYEARLADRPLCLHCGVPLEPRRGRGRPALYCGAAHKQRVYEQRLRAYS